MAHRGEKMPDTQPTTESTRFGLELFRTRGCETKPGSENSAFFPASSAPAIISTKQGTWWLTIVENAAAWTVCAAAAASFAAFSFAGAVSSAISSAFALPRDPPC